MVRCAVAEESECGIGPGQRVLVPARARYLLLPVRVDAERYRPPIAAQQDDRSRSPGRL